MFAAQVMAALTRSQTNLEEVETNPFAHKYMVKRPRLREATTTTSIGHGELPNLSNGIAQDRQPSLPEEPKIDNPAMEEREFLNVK